MKYLDTLQFASLQEACLEPDFVAKILQFPKSGRHAQVNAAFSAELLESDRRRTRQEQIKRLLAGYEQDRLQLDHVIATLRQEYMLLEVGRG